jgi:D-amino-acid oxidase
MPNSIAIIGAGVSGLTCGVVFAERGHHATIFAEETGQQTTSAAAAAIWYPYDAEPADKVIAWALQTYNVFVNLSREPGTGVSMIELRNFSRTGEIEIPAWAYSLGARPLVMSSEYASPARTETSLTVNPAAFTSGFVMHVPLIDTTIYLDYLAQRFRVGGGEIHGNVHFDKLEDVDQQFDLVINCAGIGARTLVNDADLEPHRGQVAIIPKLDLPYALVCDDAPLTYAIPRTNDCVFGGTNELSDDRTIDSLSTKRIVTECSRTLGIEEPRVLRERVGLRPFRKSGVRVEPDCLPDGRVVIHNYGHGGAGFTLSWGCAGDVSAFAQAALPLPNE